MKKLLLGIVVLVIVIISSILAITYISLGNGIIFGEDDVGPGNPDSNPGEDSEDVITGIRFDVPSSSSVTLAETCNFNSIPIEGTVYGTDLDLVDFILFFWHDNIEYSRFRISLGQVEEYGECKRYDEYNYIWKMRMYIGRLGSGNHLLTARAMKNNNNILAEASIVVVIPEKWVYKWDSRDPFSSDAYVSKDYYYCFEMPYHAFHIESVDWLKGEIIKIKGSIYAELFEDRLTSPVWLNFWNTYTDKWTTVDKDSITLINDEWVNFDINCGNIFANCISFAGCTYKNNDGSIEGYDHITGLVCEIWVKPGTIIPSYSPLDIIGGYFSDFNDPPGP